MPAYPLLASMRATARPVGPPPTIAVDEGRRSAVGAVLEEAVLVAVI